ncbi:MAG: MBL fold metallo-hydrolase [Thermodesulfovibrionales bacterium]|nr:MBL fold metallo-hydrolase [Thermodesulfovibrionales bacterium]
MKSLVVGPLEANCFIIADENTREALVIDPGDEPDRILDLITENNFKIKYIVCTHAHFDHVGAVPEIKKETGAKIVIHRDELDIYERTRDLAALWGYELDPLPEPDMFVSEGDKLEIGDLRLEVLHTPGHSPGGICLYGEGILITGDTLFAGSVGRTDFYGGDVEKLKKSFKRLMSLLDKVKVLPGHGPESTIGQERANNSFSYEIF